MARPHFQFSLRTLFVAVTAFCVAAFLFGLAIRRGGNETMSIVCVSGAATAIIAGIGVLTRSILIGVIVGVPLACAMWFFL